jgi:4-amino-4-deoxy-L-arabinose transferase-like glycosyltransferase
MNKKYFLLGLVFFIALVIRLFHLGSLPVSLDKDEAFFGYNAYAIFKTGRDMTGVLFPTHLASFLYTPAGYSYLILPSIAIFGLSEFAIRFPSALLGSVSVLLVFFVSNELLRKITKHAFNDFVSFGAALLLAFMPWHITLSRNANNAPPVMFFILGGVLCYLLYLRKKRISLLIVAFLSFALSLTQYVAPYSLLPLFIPVMVLLFIREIKNKTHVLSILILYILLILVPLFVTLLSPNLASRAKSLSIFHNAGVQLKLDEQLREDGVNNSNRLVTRAFHNKLINYSDMFFLNYFKHFSYEFLFVDQGLPLRYKIPSTGLLYLWTLPLLLYGCLKLFQNQRQVALLLFAWIILTPLGSSITIDDVPNVQRTLFMLPAYCILIAYGLVQIISSIRKAHFSLPILVVFSFIALYSIGFYFHQYTVHQLQHQSWNRQEGFKDLVLTINDLAPKYERVVITEWEGPSAIFLLMYGKYDPGRYQEETRGKFVNGYKNIGFAKFRPTIEQCPLHETVIMDTVTKVAKTIVRGDEKTLYVNHGACKTPRKNAQVIRQIKRPDNTTAFTILSYEK